MKVLLARARPRWQTCSRKQAVAFAEGSRRTHGDSCERPQVCNGYIKPQTSNILHVVMNIGFVGVGRMGANMARRLKDREFHITAVYDTNRAVATSLAAELGCAAAQDLSEVTAESDAIFTVVTDDKAVRQIFTGTGDNLLVNAGGKLFINCETISPRVEIDIEKLAHEAGAESLEACMASSITQARDGKLYLMCGGDEATFRKAEPILKELGSVVRYIGKSGEAARVKALVNMVMNINTAGLAEGLALGAALGLGLDLPLARATKEQYDRMIAEGLGELDKSGIAELTFKDRHKHSGDHM